MAASTPSSSGSPTTTDGRTAQPGVYTLIMPGNATYYPRAGTLQQKWTTFCSDLVTQIETIKGQVQRSTLDLKRVQTTLHNADSDSISAADMWLVLNDVLPATGTQTNPNAVPSS